MFESFKNAYRAARVTPTKNEKVVATVGAVTVAGAVVSKVIIATGVGVAGTACANGLLVGGAALVVVPVGKACVRGFMEGYRAERARVAAISESPVGGESGLSDVPAEITSTDLTECENCGLMFLCACSTNTEVTTGAEYVVGSPEWLASRVVQVVDNAE